MKEKNEENKIPKGMTAAEWKDILRYRRTGEIPDIPYEPLDFDKVGGEKLKRPKKKK